MFSNLITFYRGFIQIHLCNVWLCRHHQIRLGIKMHLWLLWNFHNPVCRTTNNFLFSKIYLEFLHHFKLKCKKNVFYYFYIKAKKHWFVCVLTYLVSAGLDMNKLRSCIRITYYIKDKQNCALLILTFAWLWVGWDMSW